MRGGGCISLYSIITSMDFSEEDKEMSLNNKSEC